MAKLVERQPRATNGVSGVTPRFPSLFGAAARVFTLRRRVALRLGALPALAILLFVSIVFAAAIGATPISPLVSAQILLNQTHLVHFTRVWPAYDETILLILRLPRVCGAALAGAALAVSGALFQGLLRNPLADPLLLGSSAGAALGATIAFLLPSLYTIEVLNFSLLAALAFLGALLAVALVYALATHAGRTPIVTLLLAGVAVSAILTAAQTLIITLNDRLALRLNALYYWIAGGITAQGWTQIQVTFALTLIATVGALALAPALDAFALGETMAAHLGLRVERSKLLIVALASLLVATAVAISGLVGFVGLVSPHLCRLIFGPRHRLLIASSALVGGIFVVIADLLARTIAAPSELPLGVITALVGGPFFLWLLRRSGDTYHW